MSYKMLFIGRPGTGKTTIKNVVFLEEDANELILFPLESTINASYSLHDFLDVKISLLDTAGQFLPNYLTNEEEQLDIFGDASLVIYLFSYDLWIFNKKRCWNRSYFKYSNLFKYLHYLSNIWNFD